ncbi:MAG: TetR/AcrR family transcriptional regulator [Aeromicrobium sp.]|nr:MAG: TetR/AcrR family transcriptional regulator [Aeromicrobium sp.]
MESDTGSRRGAPRSEQTHLAILDAAASQFQERGYANFTIEGVAAQAGVGKQTIYRWWPTKTDLIAECLLDGRLFPERLSIPNTGDLHTDVVDWVSQVFELIRRPAGRGLVTSLIAAATANEQIGERLRETLGGRESVVARLSAGVEAGQLSPAKPITELAEALVGALLLKALGEGRTESGDAVRLVDALLT